MNRNKTKRSMGKKMKMRLAALTACALLLSGCGGGETGTDALAMGRYMEGSLSHPDTWLISQQQRVDGTLVMYGWEADEEGKARYGRYESKDGLSWTREEIDSDLMQKVMGERVVDHITEGTAGELYLLSSENVGTLEEHQFETRLEKLNLQSGQSEEISVQWHRAPSNEYGIVSGEMKLLSNGDFLIYQSFDGYCQYGSDGRFKRVYMEGRENYNIQDWDVGGTEICFLDSENSSVLIYDGETGELKETAAFEGVTPSTILASGRENSLLLQNSKGLYRRPQGGAVWEKLIDGELNSMVMPSITFTEVFESAEGFLLTGKEDEENILLAYQYDPHVETVPSKELTVYSLDENKTLRQAAAFYQRNNTDTKVTVEVGSQFGENKSDLIRTLNTELFGGRGPDVLLLDGLNVDAYADKGMLLDISDLIQGKEGSLVEQVVKTYQKDGGIYAVPARFEVPAAFAKGEYIDQISDLKEAAKLAEANEAIGLTGNREADVLMNLLLPASAPAWLSEKSIDEEGLGEFLKLVKTIMDSPAPSYNLTDEGEPYEYDREAFQWAFGRSLTLMKPLAGYEDLTAPSMAMEMLGEGEMTYMPGMAEKIFIPRVIAAVNQNSRQQEVAKDFIGQLLEFPVQKSRLGEGFPVNLEALNDLQFNENIYMFFSSAFFEGENLMGGDIPIDLQEKVRELVLTVETPYKKDDVLTEMIINESEGYLRGQKSLEQTISDIQERARLYLAE